MAQGQRQYEAATVFNARIVNMQHLWNPSYEYEGKKSDKPSHFASFIVRKTQAQWFSEPALAGIAQACGKLFQVNPHIIQWPVDDGDTPNIKTGKHSEWAKGHWIFSGNSQQAPNVEIVQAGGALVKLQNKVGVKSGDFVMAGVTAAVKQNDPRGVKLYLNAVVFSGPGEEIVFANSVSGAELMQQAQRQGLQVAGFGAPAYNPQQGGGFAPQPFSAPPGNPSFAPGAGGFAPPAQSQGAPGFPGQSAAPQYGAPAPNGATYAPPPNPGQYAPPAGPGYAPAPANPATGYPSNPQPGQFAPPPNFAPQGGPYPQR